MLTSIRQSDDCKVYAKDIDKGDAPFKCPVCEGETVVRKGLVKIHHFSHKNPVLCDYGKGESEAHRQCKQSIFDALKLEPNVTGCELEKNFGKVVSDVFFILNNHVKIAIEIQISNLTMSRIIERTKVYKELDIYVLWMPIFDSTLTNNKYAPKLWEKWIHTTYFGSVYYWVEGLSVMPIHFDDYLLYAESTDYGGGYFRKSKRYIKPKIGVMFDILKDFECINRGAGKDRNIEVPDCNRLVDNRQNWWQ